MDNQDFDEDIEIMNGRLYAREDYEKYKKGELTLEDLHNGCEFAKWSAAYGDDTYQANGYGYLKEMEKLGIIKNLRRVD